MLNPVVAERRPNRAGERRRIQMLQAAEALVREHGHQNVTMQMIADAVGVTQPAVHHHFASRDQLFVELLRYRDRHPAETDAVDAIDGLILAASNNERSPHLAALFAEYSSRAVDPASPAHPFFAERNRLSVAGFAEAITARCRRAGTTPPVDVEQAALIIVTLSDGLISRWLVDRDLDMAATLRYALEALGVPPLM